jgi:hypothetical protein
MTSDQISTLQYWIDIAIKALVGIVISIVGLDYRAVKNSLHELEEHRYTSRMEIQVMQAELGHIKDRLERIDKKLDRVLEK